MKTSPYLVTKIFYSICILLTFIFSGCEKNTNNSAAPIELDSLTIENYPKVDGSTSTHPLQVLIACILLDVEYEWMPSFFDETYRIWPSFEVKPEIAGFIVDSIVHSGTHGSYVNLIDGKADVILVARTASEDENNLADSMQVELISKPVALDAFVFIANIQNPVESLTVEQIQDIYMGNITHWNEVGGNNEVINPYQGNPNSGSQELMLSLVMKDLPMMNFPDMILYSMMGPINQITHDLNGLGYTVYFFEQFMAPNDSLKLLAVNGIKPEYSTLKSRDYIYTTEVYAVIRDDLDPESNACLLYHWLSTRQGRLVIDESGYIPY
jgi:phosphate transport system substrate-binding protein